MKTETDREKVITQILLDVSDTPMLNDMSPEDIALLLMRLAYDAGKEDAETEWLDSHRLFSRN
jgi:hypothetical protein